MIGLERFRVHVFVAPSGFPGVDLRHASKAQLCMYP